MKQLFLEKSLGIVKSSYPQYNNDTLSEIKYGLEAFYLTITKAIVIFSIAALLHLLKETLFLCICFNILRFSGFGIHATKSWMCWVSSSIIFLFFPYLCSNIILPSEVLLVTALLCEVNFLLFAPADTKKRPLINKRKRMVWKICTVISGLVFICFILISQNALIQNTLLSAMLIESAMINPIVYKIFHLPYNNYKSYIHSTKE